LIKNTGSFNETDELINWFWYAKMFFGRKKITKNLFDRKNTNYIKNYIVRFWGINTLISHNWEREARKKVY